MVASAGAPSKISFPSAKSGILGYWNTVWSELFGNVCLLFGSCTYVQSCVRPILWKRSVSAMSLHPHGSESTETTQRASRAWRFDGVWGPIFGDIRLCQPKGFERQWGGGFPEKMSRPKRASRDREGEWVCLNEKQGRPDDLEGVSTGLREREREREMEPAQRLRAQRCASKRR